tara:strand:+ start:1590 stop:1994 length:405 start_codon:yes stop_codon:yes gene_type:complete
MENQPYYQTFNHWFFNWVHDEYPHNNVFFDNTFSKLTEEDREYLHSGLEKGYIEMYIDTDSTNTYEEYEYDLHGEIEDDDDITIFYEPLLIHYDMHLYLYPDDLFEHKMVLIDMGVLTPPHQNRIVSTRRISDH